MYTLIWDWAQFLEEATFLLIFFPWEVRFDYCREFKEVSEMFQQTKYGKDGKGLVWNRVSNFGFG